MVVAINPEGSPRRYAGISVGDEPARRALPAFTVGPRSARLLAMESTGSLPKRTLEQPPGPNPHDASVLDLPLRSDIVLTTNLGDTASAGTATAYQSDVYVDGYPCIVLENARVRVVFSPQAGGRAFAFYDRKTLGNVFTTVGGLRDDLAFQMPQSQTDRIAAFTHTFPAGTFNRPYRAEILETGKRAVVRLSYDMPDALPAGAHFERTITLLPDARTFTVEERATFQHDDNATQHAVSISSLAVGKEPPSDWKTYTAPDGFGLYSPGSKVLATVRWNRDQMEGEELKPYRSSVSLFMRLARVPVVTITYGLWYADDEGAAQSKFTELMK